MLPFLGHFLVIVMSYLFSLCPVLFPALQTEIKSDKRAGPNLDGLRKKSPLPPGKPPYLLIVKVLCKLLGRICLFVFLYYIG